MNDEASGVEGVSVTLAGASADAEYGRLTLEAWRYDDGGAAVSSPQSETLSFSLPEGSEVSVRVAESERRVVWFWV